MSEHATADTRFVKLSKPSIDLSSSASVVPSGAGAPAGATVSSSSSNTVCAKYLGSIGGMWPTPQRGHWFPNAGDTDSFRQKMKDACPADKAMVSCLLCLSLMVVLID